MIGFVVDVLKCRTERNRLRAENGRLKADVRWLSDENEGLTAALGEAVREGRRVSRLLLNAVSPHPAIRASLKQLAAKC